MLDDDCWVLDIDNWESAGIKMKGEGGWDSHWDSDVGMRKFKDFDMTASN